jgi:hypothetical protein
MANPKPLCARAPGRPPPQATYKQGPAAVKVMYARKHEREAMKVGRRGGGGEVMKVGRRGGEVMKVGQRGGGGGD